MGRSCGSLRFVCLSSLVPYARRHPDDGGGHHRGLQQRQAEEFADAPLVRRFTCGKNRKT